MPPEIFHGVTKPKAITEFYFYLPAVVYRLVDYGTMEKSSRITNCYSLLSHFIFPVANFDVQRLMAVDLTF